MSFRLNRSELVFVCMVVLMLSLFGFSVFGVINESTRAESEQQIQQEAQEKQKEADRAWADR